MQTKNSPYLIGIDLGGTKIIGVLLDAQHERLAVIKKSTKAHLGKDNVLAKIVSIIEELLASNQLTAEQIACIGVGVPGPVNHKTGQIITAPNLGWKDMDLKGFLQEKFHCFVEIQNDVNAGTYAEYVLSLHKQFQHVIGLFIGTGFGGGVILNGQLYYGATGYAGEIGHTIIRKNGLTCNCGNKGCLEAYASKISLMKDIKKNLHLPELAEIKEGLSADSNFVLKSGLIRKMVLEKNPYMTKKVKKIGKNIALGILNTVNLLNPEAIILGGGFVDALSDVLLPQIVKTLNRKALITPVHNLEIRIANLGDDAVMLGAALLAEEAKSKLTNA